MKIKFFYLLFVVLTLSACNGNDDDSSNDDNNDNQGIGQFTIDNSSFDLSKGFRSPVFEDEPGLYYQNVLLSSDGFNLNTTAGDNPLTGTADAIFIELYSSSDNAPITGTYNVTDTDENPGDAYVYYAINYNIDADTIDDEEEIESGSLTITQNSDGSYSVSLTNGVVDITGQDFTVTYDGDIMFLND